MQLCKCACMCVVCIFEHVCMCLRLCVGRSVCGFVSVQYECVCECECRYL